MVFPETVGAFRRDDVISYNSERTDESATYIQEKDGKESVAITIYVYPVPLDIGSALAQSLPQRICPAFSICSRNSFSPMKNKPFPKCIAAPKS
jgi:hypothetical protein